MLKRIIAWTCLALAFLGPPVAFAPAPALAQGYIGTLAQPPAWVLPEASIDCDWQNQRFYNCAYDTTFLDGNVLRFTAFGSRLQ